MLTRRQTYFSRLLKQDLGHHAFVFVIQQMTMEHRHALDGGVSKIQDDIDRTVIRNIHGIQPRRMRERNAVLCIGQEVDLVYVEWMEFGSSIHDTPMLINTYANACHRTCVGRELASIDVKTVLVLREGDNEVRCSLLQRLNVYRLVERRAVIGGMHLRRCWL